MKRGNNSNNNNERKKMIFVVKGIEWRTSRQLYTVFIFGSFVPLPCSNINKKKLKKKNAMNRTHTANVEVMCYVSNRLPHARRTTTFGRQHWYKLACYTKTSYKMPMKEFVDAMQCFLSPNGFSHVHCYHTLIICSTAPSIAHNDPHDDIAPTTDDA